MTEEDSTESTIQKVLNLFSKTYKEKILGEVLWQTEETVKKK